MQRQFLLIGAVVVILLLGGGFFVAKDLGFIGGSSRIFDAFSLAPVSPPREGNTTGTGGNSSQSVSQRYSVRFRDDISLASGRSAVLGTGGTVLYELPLTHVLIAELTETERVGLINRPDVIWVEKEHAVELQSLGVFSLSVAYAAEAEAVEIYVIDYGEHNTRVVNSIQEELKSGGEGIKIHSLDVRGPDDEMTVPITAERIMQAVNAGADVINISSVCPGCSRMDPSEEQALNYARSHGVVVVNSAGNEPGFFDPHLAHLGVISVGGLTIDGKVDTNLSGNTAETKADFYTRAESPDGQYGTSFAAPRIAARAAVIMRDPVGSYDVNGNGRWDTEEVEARLRSDAKTTKAYASGDELFSTTGRPVTTVAAPGTPTGTSGPGATTVAAPTPGGTPAPGSTPGPITVGTPTPTPSPTPGRTTVGLPPSSSGSASLSGGDGTEFLQGTRRGIVPQCEFGGVGCRACDLAKLANNLIKFSVAFSVIVATIMFAYAGILYLTAAGKGPDQIKKAHGIFGNVFVGLLFVLLAWLIVDIVFSVLTDKGLTQWAKIDCASNPITDPFPKVNDGGARQGWLQITGGGGTASNTALPNNGMTHLDALRRLRETGVCDANGASCTNLGSNTSFEGVRIKTVEQVVALHQGCNCSFSVNSVTSGGHAGMDSIFGHTHKNGYKIDVQVGSPLDDFIPKTVAKSVDNGGKPVRWGGGQAIVYRDSCGNVYAKELPQSAGQKGHWDIQVNRTVCTF